MTTVVLAFLILGIGHDLEDARADATEAGEIRAPSCAIAERYIRAGLKPGQELQILSCEQEAAATAEATP